MGMVLVDALGVGIAVGVGLLSWGVRRVRRRRRRILVRRFRAAGMPAPAKPTPPSQTACHTAAVLLARLALAQAEHRPLRLDQELSGTEADHLVIDGDALGTPELVAGALLVIHDLVRQLAATADSSLLQVVQQQLLAAEVDRILAAVSPTDELGP